MPTAYEALRSNIYGEIYYFKFQQNTWDIGDREQNFLALKQFCPQGLHCPLSAKTAFYLLLTALSLPSGTIRQLDDCTTQRRLDA